jgi:hypothetical protein
MLGRPIAAEPIEGCREIRDRLASWPPGAIAPEEPIE